MVFCSLGKIANVHSLGLFIFVSLSPLVMKAYATDNIQFNTDVLDVRDRKNIDLSQFFAKWLHHASNLRHGCSYQ